MENKLKRLRQNLSSENDRHSRQINSLKQQIERTKEQIDSNKEFEKRKKEQARRQREIQTSTPYNIFKNEDLIVQNLIFKLQEARKSVN